MNESVGARLRIAREARRLTLVQVSETTRIRAHYLQALENDDLSVMPSGAQARGFLRIYAQFLGLNITDLLSQLIISSTEPDVEPKAVAAGPGSVSGSQASRPNILMRLRSRFFPSRDTDVSVTPGTTSESSFQVSPIPRPEDLGAPVPLEDALEVPASEEQPSVKKKVK